MKKSGALAGKNKMSNQTGAVIGAIATAVNWERKGLNLQDIIEAANKGLLGGPLTDWLATQGWLVGQVTTTPTPKPTPSILELVSTVVVNATTGKFVAKEKFVINTKRNAPVKISYLGDNFKAWFMNGDGKTEDPISEQTLRYHKLRQSSVDGPIITELGGETKAETTLSEMFSLMEKQKHGEDGVLLNNGYANIFYIKDSAGVLRTVDVFWNDDGWVCRCPLRRRCGHVACGLQVFSRNSALMPSDTLVPAQA